MVPIMLFAKTLVIWCQRKRGGEAANEQIEMEELQEEHDDYEIMSNEEKNSNEEMRKKESMASPKFRQLVRRFVGRQRSTKRNRSAR